MAKALQFVTGAGAGLGTHPGAGNPIFCYSRENSKGNCFAIQVHTPGCLIIPQPRAPLAGTSEPNAQVPSFVGGWLLRNPQPQLRNLRNLPFCLLLAPFCAPKEGMGGTIPSLAIWAQDLFLSTQLCSGCSGAEKGPKGRCCLL